MSSSPRSGQNHTCSSPRQCSYEEDQKQIRLLREQVQTQRVAIDRLNLDIKALNTKYVAEIERTTRIQHERDLIEYEVEELTSRLFEEANSMVVQEKQERFLLENRLRDMQHELNELRQYGMRSDHPPHYILSQSRISSVHMDNAFRDFVFSAPHMPLNKLPELAFLKACQDQDIDACLSVSTSPLSRKTWMTNMLLKPCLFDKAETAPTPLLSMQQEVAGFAALYRSLWERFATPSTANTDTTLNVSRCGICNASAMDIPLSFRVRLGENTDWIPIDRPCRDRLAAVCAFYAFIRNVHANQYADHDLQELYMESARLRLQMFYARMGILVNGDAARGQEDDELSLNGSVSTGSGPCTPLASRIMHTMEDDCNRDMNPWLGGEFLQHV